MRPTRGPTRHAELLLARTPSPLHHMVSPILASHFTEAATEVGTLAIKLSVCNSIAAWNSLYVLTNHHILPIKRQKRGSQYGAKPIFPRKSWTFCHPRRSPNARRHRDLPSTMYRFMKLARLEEQAPSSDQVRFAICLLCRFLNQHICASHFYPELKKRFLALRCIRHGNIDDPSWRRSSM